MRSWVVLVLLVLFPERAAWADAALEARCSDAALGRAAARQLSLRSSLGRGWDRLTSDPVVYSLRTNPLNDEEASTWFAALQARVDAPLRCGVARDMDASLWLASARAATLDLWIEDGRVIAKGRLEPGFEHPQLFVWVRGRRVHSFSVRPPDLEHGVALLEDAAGVAAGGRVQLTARGSLGLRPVAQRDWGGFEPPEVSARTPFDLVQAIRRAHGVPSVRTNQILRRAALRQARAICERGQVGHELREGMDPEVRIRMAGLKARAVGEALARIGHHHPHELTDALSALAHSASHRMTLSDRRFTDVGAGVVVQDGDTCVAILLASWPTVAVR